VLQLVNGKVPILIEIKNKGKVGELEQDVYNEIKGYKGKLAVQSFNPYSLKWFRQNVPHIIRGQLSGSFKDEDLAWYKKFMLKNLLLNFESKPAFIAYEIEALPKPVVSKQSQRGSIVLGWTARSSEQYRQALKYCDNVIFEGLSPKEEIE
jgi:glycerophosphoryl diester phosphodiesterase